MKRNLAFHKFHKTRLSHKRSTTIINQNQWADKWLVTCNRRITRSER